MEAVVATGGGASVSHPRIFGKATGLTDTPLRREAPLDGSDRDVSVLPRGAEEAYFHRPPRVRGQASQPDLLLRWPLTHGFGDSCVSVLPREPEKGAGDDIGPSGSECTERVCRSRGPQCHLILGPGWGATWPIWARSSLQRDVGEGIAHRCWREAYQLPVVLLLGLVTTTVPGPQKLCCVWLGLQREARLLCPLPTDSLLDARTFHRNKSITPTPVAPPPPTPSTCLGPTGPEHLSSKRKQRMGRAHPPPAGPGVSLEPWAWCARLLARRPLGMQATC